MQARNPEFEISLHDYLALREAGTAHTLIDVREDWEYEKGHVPGAVHIPLGQIPDRRKEFIAEDDSPVYVICQAGGRSYKAAEYLIQEGVDVISVDGGTGQWIAEGHEVETADSES